MRSHTEDDTLRGMYAQIAGDAAFQALIQKAVTEELTAEKPIPPNKDGVIYLPAKYPYQ